MLRVIKYVTKSLKITRNEILEKGVSPGQYFVEHVTMCVSRTVSKIFSVK